VTTSRSPSLAAPAPAWQVLSAYALAQAFYLHTLAPTLLWGDDAKFQWMAYVRDLRVGAQWDHPFWILVAHPFTRLPLGDIAWRANAFASLWAAVAVALAYATLVPLTRSRWAAAVGAGALVVSHTFWTHAVRSEVYSLSLALFAGGLYCALLPRRSPLWLCLAGLLTGLGINNHVIGWVTVPGLALVGLWRLRQERIPAWWLLPAGLCLGAPVVAFRLALPGQYAPPLDLRTYLPDGPLLVRQTGLFVAYLALQVPGPAAVLMVVGAVRSWRRPLLGLGLALTFLGNVAGVLHLTASDQFSFYFLSYAVGAYWAGLGATPAIVWLGDRLSALRRAVAPGLFAATVVLPVAAYAVLPTVLPRIGITAETLGIREIPGRPALEFFLNPSKRHYTGAREFGEAMLNSLPQDAIIIVDYAVWEALLYLQNAEGLRTDVQAALVPAERQVDFALRHAAERPVYVALLEPYTDREGLSRHFAIVPDGPVYRLEASGS